MYFYEEISFYNNPKETQKKKIKIKNSRKQKKKNNNFISLH